MSLLLDALKKAAKDKRNSDDSNPENIAAESLELESLDEGDSSVADSSQTESVTEGAKDDSSSSHASDIQKDDQADEINVSRLTVSDEALQILVHKTNKQFKARQRLVWSSIFLLTLTLLVSGGAYFYIRMIDDVEAVERRHKLVMRSVTDTRLSRSVTEKVEQQQAMLAKEAKQNTKEARAITKVQSGEVVEKDTSITQKKLTLKKTKKPDPIGLLVNKAWMDYEAGDYESAKSQYDGVLKRERNNRDALLGIAAIAVRQDEIDMARLIYERLVQLDPRDPIAIAALSNLDTVSVDSLSESKLKLMIRHNEKAPHLYFALGNIYSQQKKWPEAQQAYFSAWQNDDKNADYAFNLAISLDQMGKQGEAMEFYEMSLSNAESRTAQFSTETVRDRLQQLSGGQDQ